MSILNFLKAIRLPSFVNEVVEDPVDARIANVSPTQRRSIFQGRVLRGLGRSSKIRAFFFDLLEAVFSVGPKAPSYEEMVERAEQHGLQLHRYIPEIDCPEEDEKLREAVEGLNRLGFLLTRQDGTIFGKFVPMSSRRQNEVVLRRSQFRLVRVGPDSAQRDG